jgi:hypothetical protein
MHERRRTRAARRVTRLEPPAGARFAEPGVPAIANRGRTGVHVSGAISKFEFPNCRVTAEARRARVRARVGMRELVEEVEGKCDSGAVDLKTDGRVNRILSG